jgi:hypothetical protein
MDESFRCNVTLFIVGGGHHTGKPMSVVVSHTILRRRFFATSICASFQRGAGDFKSSSIKEKEGGT